jgi:hypothetical protein
MQPSDIEAWLGFAVNLGSPLLTVLACIAAAYLFRSFRGFKNKNLWIVCGVAGIVAFPLLALQHRSVYGANESVYEWLFRGVTFGHFLGLGAWAFHDKILRRCEHKIPILASIVSVVDALGKPAKRKHKKHK